MRFVGVDVNAQEVNLVSVDLDTMEATQHLLVGAERAFETARLMTTMMPHSSWWDDVALVAVERPSGRFKNVIYAQGLVIGAVLAIIPNRIVVQTFVPANWRRLIDLPGNASKEMVQAWASEYGATSSWDEHACDALALAHAALAYNNTGVPL